MDLSNISYGNVLNVTKNGIVDDYTTKFFNKHYSIILYTTISGRITYGRIIRTLEELDDEYIKNYCRQYYMNPRRLKYNNYCSLQQLLFIKTPTIFYKKIR